VEMLAKWEVCQDVQNPNFPDGDLVTNKVKINLNMFRALVLNWVGYQVDGTNNVAIDKCVAECSSMCNW
jgi:hypothetical protein